MDYFTELRDHWRPLLAATIGMGTGMSFAGQITPVLAEALVKDSGWSRAEFAMVGSLALLTAFSFPFVGRLADVLGVRLTALIGMITLPLAFLAYSMMNGNLSAYIVIFVLQSMICVTTTATVYTRLVVQNFVRARGLALAIAASGPGLSVAVIAPLLNSYIEHQGWRAGYQALAIFAVVAAIVTFVLIPREKPKDPAQALPRPAKRRAREDYPVIFRSRAFWLLLGAMLLCNLPATIMLVQLKMLVVANGIRGEDAGIMLAALPIGQLAGRFIAGLGLDRFRPHIVSFVTLAMPSIGLFLIASSLDTVAVLTFSVFCIGFAFGAEGDILGFLVARHFGVQIYSSVMGLMTFATSVSTASGALLLGLTMAATGGYETYLVIAGVGVLIGASFLLVLGDGREPAFRDKEIESAIPVAPVPGGAA